MAIVNQHKHVDARVNPSQFRKLILAHPRGLAVGHERCCVAEQRLTAASKPELGTYGGYSKCLSENAILREKRFSFANLSQLHRRALAFAACALEPLLLLQLRLAGLQQREAKAVTTVRPFQRLP